MRPLAPGSLGGIEAETKDDCEKKMHASNFTETTKAMASVAPGLGLGAPFERFPQTLWFSSGQTWKVPFTKEKLPCPFKNEFRGLKMYTYWLELNACGPVCATAVRQPLVDANVLRRARSTSSGRGRTLPVQTVLEDVSLRYSAVVWHRDTATGNQWDHTLWASLRWLELPDRGRVDQAPTRWVRGQLTTVLAQSCPPSASLPGLKTFCPSG